MKTIQIIGLLLTFVTSTHAFVASVPFKEQIQRADAVARIVVVQIAKLDYTDQEDWTFTGMAKCRIVTDYTGALMNRDFIYIPCAYTFDESPSPLEVGRDYIVNLELLKNGRIAHPVSHDAAHVVSNRKLIDPESADSKSMLSVEDFEIRLRAQLKKKAEQAGTGQPVTRPESKSEGGDNLQPEAEGRSR
jgi:hypothetical protein